ncbi:hypothetical protein FOTG_19084 [Fusarium oxysporum f. sp. vasinfectum 25433]|uniref:Uncharacterized protein n=1 Tax=Fusarium oxysporum f. sp. vasinfectum 25433 TaxID=1089449 RepID=X0LV81_FUSOX|nr:hypothetical protein FOTG_19084 [Fusarium oxysporum f. sp. vasinfectum 25433]
MGSSVLHNRVQFHSWSCQHRQSGSFHRYAIWSFVLRGQLENQSWLRLGTDPSWLADKFHQLLPCYSAWQGFSWTHQSSCL